MANLTKRKTMPMLELALAMAELTGIARYHPTLDCLSSLTG